MHDNRDLGANDRSIKYFSNWFLKFNLNLQNNPSHSFSMHRVVCDGRENLIVFI